METGEKKKEKSVKIKYKKCFVSKKKREPKGPKKEWNKRTKNGENN